MDWISSQLATLPAQAGWLFLSALVLSAGGFYRVVYFISVGYAFSILGMALLTPMLLGSLGDVFAALHALLLGAYGFRLGSFLVQRERQPSFQKELPGIEARSNHLRLGTRLAIWVAVSILYVWMFSPGLFHLVASVASEGAGWRAAMPGTLIMAFGLCLEALSDAQKSRYKAQNPHRFTDVGLFRLVRCPNYLGEILFWLGNFLAGIPYYTSALRWGMALGGLVCITLIMMGSTKRLEQQQDERYGAREDYQKYVTTVPVLFPFTRIYSLKHVRVYLE